GGGARRRGAPWAGGGRRPGLRGGRGVGPAVRRAGAPRLPPQRPPRRPQAPGQRAARLGPDRGEELQGQRQLEEPAGGGRAAQGDASWRRLPARWRWAGAATRRATWP